MPPKMRTRNSYGVGVVCALPLEAAAVYQMLDEEHPKLPPALGDSNIYMLGRIGDHDVVIACLPAGSTGKAQAAAVAVNMTRSFGIRVGLMVGIGGGVPSKDIRLGDVVVNQPTDRHGGVVQWDLGKTETTEHGSTFRRTGTLDRPPVALLNALSSLQAQHEFEEPRMSQHIGDMLSRQSRMRAGYSHPGRENDWLFDTDYNHEGELGDCNACDKNRLVPRSSSLDERGITVHFGNIASGDQVMRDAKTRDRIAAEEKVICFEMEAAGLMNNFPCLVIRGICDYADSHKDKRWQRYAAATAAAYAKEILLTMQATEVAKIQEEEQIPRVHNIPFNENPDFVGRLPELEALEKKFFGEPCRQTVALFGLGGIGKTQVALSFAYSVWKNRLDYSIFWVPAVSPETIDRAFVEIAEKLQILRPDDKTNAQEVVCKHLSDTKSGKWLLIIDNADDVDFVVRDVLSNLPRSSQGLTLFTTRTREVGRRVARTDVINMEKVSDEDAMTILRQAVSCGDSQISHDESVAMKQLLEELDNLPLAIMQAAAYIDVNYISVADYLNLIRDSEKEAIEVLSAELGDDTRYTHVDSTIATTYLISFHKIAEQNPYAAETLRYISCIEWKAIPMSILPQWDLKAHSTRAVGTLCSYALLSERQDERLGDKIYDMHRLVHLATRIWNEKFGEPEATRRWALAHLASMHPYGEYEDREKWRAYLPHAARVKTRAVEPENENKGLLCNRVGWCLYIDARIKEAISWLEEAHRCFGDLVEDHPDRLVSQYELARAYLQDRRTKEAVELLEQVVRVQEALVEDHPNRLVSERMLATTYLQDGRTKEAVDLLEHEVRVREALVEDHPHRLASQHELARAYLQDGRTKEAVELLEQVVRVQEALVEDHPYLLAPQHALASAYLQDGRTKEAVDLLEQVVRVDEVLVEDNPNRLASQYALARAYLQDGRTKEVVELLEHVIAIRKGTLREDHPDILLSQRELARAFLADSRVNEAVELAEHVVVIQKSTLKEDHLELLSSQHELARAFLADSRVDEAVELLEHVVAMRKATLREDHPDRLGSQHELARAFLADSRVDEAVELLEHVVATRKATLREDHPHRIESEQLLAETLSRRTGA